MRRMYNSLTLLGPVIALLLSISDQSLSRSRIVDHGSSVFCRHLCNTLQIKFAEHGCIASILQQRADLLNIDLVSVDLTIPGQGQLACQPQGKAVNGAGLPAANLTVFPTRTPERYPIDAIGANNGDVSKTAGSTSPARRQTAFWQTAAFVLIVIQTASTALWVLCILRFRNMAQQVKTRSEDRVGAGEGIASELHDTLLQDFQGLTMRFQSIAEQIPPTERMRRLLDEALDRAEEVLVESRDQLKKLRAGDEKGEFAFLIEAAAYRLRLDPEVAINVVIEGDCKLVRPVVRDELLAIASEALFNAFTHSHAKQVDVALACDQQSLRLRIVDNGVGIPPASLASAKRRGRSGLAGMNHRARKLKSRLSLTTGGGGSEVLVTVPRRIAYTNPRKRWSLFARRIGLES